MCIPLYTNKYGCPKNICLIFPRSHHKKHVVRTSRAHADVRAKQMTFKKHAHTRARQTHFNHVCAPCVYLIHTIVWVKRYPGKKLKGGLPGNKTHRGDNFFQKPKII